MILLPDASVTQIGEFAGVLEVTPPYKTEYTEGEFLDINGLDSIDNTTATVNGAEATMDVPARLVNDKTMVPLRFLSENLGYTVTWDEETNTASIE